MELVWKHPRKSLALALLLPPGRHLVAVILPPERHLVAVILPPERDLAAGILPPGDSGKPYHH